MRNAMRIGEGTAQATASPTRQGCTPKLVRDMKIGDTAWTLPRAVSIDLMGRLWLCLSFPVVSSPDCHAIARVVKTVDSYSIQVESEWTPLSRIPGLAYRLISI